MLLQHAHTVQDKRLPAIKELLQQGNVAFVEPDGGSCLLVQLPAGTDDVAFATQLKLSRHVCVTPASLFGSVLRGYLRIACAAFAWFICDCGTHIVKIFCRYMHRPEAEVMTAVGILVTEVGKLSA
jgi:hypothetical protein